MDKVLITGITGFVGSHLADYHLARNAEVYGFRRYHLSPMAKVAHIEDRISWVDCDMTDQKAVTAAVRTVIEQAERLAAGWR